MKKSLPAVSVIIPAYNAERYLGLCLESLLIQTLTDFEVIVVDDCSTDAGPAVAESYLERFGGQLKIVALEKNSGSGAVPRNTGLRFSRGEYVFFLDADDLLVDTALEKLRDSAEKFRADVVCMSQGFVCEAEADINELLLADWEKNPQTPAAPTLETDNLAERLEKMFATTYGWAPWIKFLRRDFLIGNDINFPEMRPAEDVVWTIELVCLAERWLTVPDRLYIYRKSKNSMMRSTRTPAEEIKFWLDPLIKGTDYLDAFLRGVKFFARHPNYRFDVTNFFVKMQIAGMLGALKELTNHELYELIHGECSKVDGKHAALIANLLVFVNFYRNKSLEVR